MPDNKAYDMETVKGDLQKILASDKIEEIHNIAQNCLDKLGAGAEPAAEETAGASLRDKLAQAAGTATAAGSPEAAGGM